MLYSAVANFLMLVHFCFILFVILGGLLLFWWPRLVFVHLPTAAWGVMIELNHWICPLTPLEQSMRHAAGQDGYTGGFIDHYINPLIYPEGLTPQIQQVLGFSLLLLNVVIYGIWLLQRFIVRKRAG
ncbi:MAG: DUF2784 domain-containing protein [Proteobacteria bacterium]|nr:DUF2784 domain-containing protein [Pseudomonadota bacterium]